jgi:hemerythrin-like domain-containing protein
MEIATQNLENDHVQILRLIEVMERITESGDPDVEHLESIVKVIREFADGLHHAKEEQLLFPLMVQKGFSNQTGPVAVMLHDHVEGRNFVKEIIENISLYKQGESSALKVIYSNMLGYADLLKNHIAKENTVLFRLADKAFTTAEQESLLHDFTKIENNQGTGHSKADYTLLIDNLASIYTTGQIHTKFEE